MSAEAVRPWIVIAGPTASGKTELSLQLAEEFSGEVLCTDSMQVYRGLDIGTAKPTPEEQRRVPHHLLDRVEPDEAYSAGRYVREAWEVIEQLRQRARLPLLVGGTGLYYRALTQGLSDIPEVPEDVRASVLAEQQEHGTPACWKRLQQIDPRGAASLHPNDTSRVTRALEVFQSTGRSILDYQSEQPFASQQRPLWIGGFDFPRAELYERINQRVLAMLDQGWVDEVEHLRQHHSPDIPGFRAIGYGEIRQHLEGQLSRADMIARIQQRTRQYAKRQLTWFRREPHFRWHAPGAWAEIREEIQQALEAGSRSATQPPQRSSSAAGVGD
ncbi:MAG: tRNA (adenosine(37)-N6)-dimethylallyltransferase MiaA [bacterium]